MFSEHGFIAFLDESGNTGRNYLDKDQPFYVSGGWIIEERIRDRCTDLVLGWERFYVKPGTREVKAKYVLDKTDGPDRILVLTQNFINIGALPSFCLYEKTFGICTAITESFWGVQLQTAQGLSTIKDAQIRNGIATCLFRCLSKKTVRAFGLAIYRSDEDMFREANRDMRNELLEHGHLTLATSAESVPIHMSIAYAFSGTKIENAINRSVFHTQLMLLEGYCRKTGYPHWQLVHDEMPVMEEEYRKIVTNVESEPESIYISDNGFTFYWGPLHMSGMTFSRSEEEPLVRAADFLAGFIARMCVRREQYDRILSTRKELLNKIMNIPVINDAPLVCATLGPETESRLASLLSP